MRVVSLLASGTEIVCGLGAGEWLVGRSHECDNPPWVTRLPECTRPAFDILMSSGRIDAEVRRRLKAGEPLYHVDTELIHSLRPDLLIAQEHCEVLRGHSGRRPAGRMRRRGPGAGAAGRQRAGDLRRHLRDRSRTRPRTGCGQPGRRDETPHGRRPRRGRTPSCAEPGRPGVDRSGLRDGQLGPGVGRGGQRPARAGGKRRTLQRHRLAAGVRCRSGMAHHRTLRIRPGAHACARHRRWKSLPGWSDLRAVRQGQVVLADGNRYFNRSGTTIVQTVEILAEVIHGYPAGHRGRAWVSHSRLRETLRVRELHAQACASNRPTYTDPVTGYEVFTADFLKQRGYCCGNGCRHCPYPSDAAAMANR